MMKKLLLLLFLSTTLLFGAYTQKVKLPSVTFAMEMDKNFGVMQRNCQWCHSYGYILNQGNQSRQFWYDMVVRMRDVFKAPILKQDEEVITDYLYRYYGNQNENNATLSELTP
jgi:hypothetical protein